MPDPPSEAADVLLEIGVEEMPADDVAAALKQTEISAPKLFDELRLARSGIELYATPRRIVVIARGVAPRQADEEFIAKGPPADRAYDADGNPTRAAQGFARGKGVAVDDLSVREMDGGTYVIAWVRREGQPTVDILAKALPAFIADLKFNKTMRWNETGVAFSRPIRWIAALFGEAVIPFDYAGVASGNLTHGLRPYGSPEIILQDAAAYQGHCEAQGVVLNFAARRALILRQIKELASEVGGILREDDELLDEVTNLVEAPTAFRGSFAAGYLDLPRDVLVTVMRKHQRYFALEDKDGRLLNYFIGARNGDSEHLGKVISGNEQVLRARFSDAQFFYQADIKKPLRDYLPRLDTLTFQAELGSMRQKNDRVAASVPGLGELLGFDARSIAVAERAAAIAKADLATSMVVEMTSLQGIMGREYALREGVDAAVATAIFEHWLPRGAGDSLPASDAGRLLALADKLDSLAGLFVVGLAPKSTSDPYGLRRSALGVIQILLDRSISVDLRTLIAYVAAGQPLEIAAGVRRQVADFISGRFDNLLSEEYAYPRDVINAVLTEQAHDPARAVQGVGELAAWVKRDGWEAILDAFARCARITRAEDKLKLDPALLSDEYEFSLYETYRSAADGLCAAANVDAFLCAFESMVPAVTAFFDNVLVHSDDITLRNNRIALLQLVAAMQHGRADLSKLENF